MFLQLALNEDGSLPGDSLPFLEGFIWFFVTPVTIVLVIWLLVVASENVKKAKQVRAKRELVSRIDD